MGTYTELPRDSAGDAVDLTSDAARRLRKVVVVDDHHLVRVALHTLLDPEPDLEIVGEAASLAAGRELLTRARPDLLVLDVHLPDGEGLELCAIAAERGIATVILTAFDRDEILIDAIRAGASGYILKHDPAESILAALRTVGAGGAHFSKAATPQMLAMISDGLPEDPLAGLSDRDRTLLALLGEGLSNRQIAERLFLSERTVKNYVSRLLRTLDLDSRTAAAVLAARVDSTRDSSRYSMAAL